jgi:hypothetical protein
MKTIERTATDCRCIHISDSRGLARGVEINIIDSSGNFTVEASLQWFDGGPAGGSNSESPPNIDAGKDVVGADVGTFPECSLLPPTIYDYPFGPTSISIDALSTDRSCRYWGSSSG